MDTLSMQAGYTAPGGVTGKPSELGGSEGRIEATSRGVVLSSHEARKELRMHFPNGEGVVQGVVEARRGRHPERQGVHGRVQLPRQRGRGREDLLRMGPRP